MHDKLKSFIAQHKLIAKSDKIALAISGGKDSVFAAHILNEMKQLFVMVHVNFNLRGEESNGDALFVRNLSADLEYCNGVFVKNVNTVKYANEQKLNSQLAAREIRYNYFDQLRSQGEFTKLITAHHQDDQLETFFINLNRQSGLKGLKSIPVKRDFIIRPFIFLNTIEIKHYLEENNIVYREDSSNISDKYARNLWRNKLLPEIAKKFPDFNKNLVSSIQKLTKENEVLNWLISEKTSQLTREENDKLYIDSEALTIFPQSAIFLYRILDGRGFNFSQCEQIVSSFDSVGAMFYSGSHQLLVDRDRFIVKNKEIENFTSIEIYSTGTFQLGEHTLDLKETSSIQFNNNPKEETVNIPKELFPLTLRYWQEGDRIQPLGMKGKKLVSDFFTDEKIDSFTKKSLPLLCLGNEVLWVPGYRISEKIKVKNEKDLFRLRMLLCSENEN